MSFVFHVIILVIPITLEAFTVTKLKGEIVNNELNSKFNDNESHEENKTITPNHKTFLQKIINSTPKLKLNIFDKMLSNEMQSMKRHLHEKDATLGPPVYMTFKNNVQTPTLEVKQRWPIEKLMHGFESNIKLNNANTDNSVFGEKYEVENEHLIDYSSNTNKIIELRSHSAIPMSTENEHLKLHCRCTKTNSHATCTHRSSEKMNSERLCTHSHICTRTPPTYPMSATYQPIYYYPSYFVGVATDSYSTFYHPDVINDLKIPKHKKHRKAKKPHNDEDLLEYYYSEEHNRITDNEYTNEKDYISNDREYENNWHNNKHKESHKKYDFDNEGDIQVKDRKKFVEEIIEDLKDYYEDTIIKDCYCSLSRSKIPNYLIIEMALFLIFTM